MSILGEAEGRLVGGNLSVLNSILGTGCFPVSEGDILMIEDLDEMFYHVDRMMLQLSRAGVLKKLSGLVIGGFSAMRDNTEHFGFSKDDPFGMSAEEIILGYVKELGIPVMLGAPVGHILQNRPMVLGKRARLSVLNSNTELEYLSS
jgi:muramoyltetrapeptide carboxypeptidase